MFYLPGCWCRLLLLTSQASLFVRMQRRSGIRTTALRGSKRTKSTFIQRGWGCPNHALNPRWKFGTSGTCVSRTGSRCVAAGQLGLCLYNPTFFPTVQWQVVPCSLFCSKFPYHDQIMTKLFPHSQLSPSKLIRPSNTQSIKLLNSYLAMHSIWIQPPHWRYGSWTFSMVGGKDVTNAMPRIITHKTLHWESKAESCSLNPLFL